MNENDPRTQTIFSQRRRAERLAERSRKALLDDLEEALDEIEDILDETEES